MSYQEQGTPEYRRSALALFLCGCATFAVLYSTQPLLPILTAEFRISPATASFSVSAATGALALCLLIAGSVSDTVGRKRLMTVVLVFASALTVLTAITPSFALLLVLRALQGALLAGISASALAYLGEEVAPKSLGLAVGLYISGNSIGGMSGRLIIGTVAGLFSWRVALGALGVVSLLFSLGFWRTLPPSSHFTPRRFELDELRHSLGAHLRDPGMLSLFGMGFLLMSGFVAMYNYIGFLLLAPPYDLSQAVVGWLFSFYIIGSFSSSWMGQLADRVGRRRVLWIAVVIMLAGAVLTLPVNLLVKLLGICVFTFGFFGAHSIATSWVSRRAKQAKAHASSLYLFCFYVGASVGGSVGGIFWSRSGWGGVVGMIVVFELLALVVAARLSAIPPLPPVPDAPVVMTSP